MATQYKGYTIRKSGRQFHKVVDAQGATAIFQRFVSVEAARCAIDARCETRVYSDNEWMTVYGHGVMASFYREQAAR